MSELRRIPVDLEAPPDDWRRAITGMDRHTDPDEQGRAQRARDDEKSAAQLRQQLAVADELLAARDRRVEQLTHALESRGPIDQAKGVLMGAFGLSADEAFETLVWVSQSANVKLSAVAERLLVEIGSIDVAEQHREDLTQLLAAMGRPHGQHFR